MTDCGTGVARERVGTVRSALVWLIALAWLVWIPVSHGLARNPRGEPAAGLTLILLRLYARCFHRVKVLGGEHVPASMHPGALIVVCNHTAGVDPVLVQAMVAFEVRWMMARDMMPRALGWLWEFAGVIAVNRAGADMTAARQALRYLAEGGVIGIFPEGGIERPARRVLPFQPGVGLLIHKSGAPVLQAIIDGTAQTETAWGSLVRRSRPGASLRFLPVRDYRAAKLGAGEIARDLRQRLIAETGWEATEERGEQTQR